MHPITNYAEIRNSIITAKDPWIKDGVKIEGADPDRRAIRLYVTKVLGEIYLGNDEKFVETLGRPCRDIKGWPLRQDNPHAFKAVITVCPILTMLKALPDLAAAEIDSAKIQKDLEAQGIEWTEMGRSLPDDEKAWPDLVYNATFLDAATQDDFHIPLKTNDPHLLRFREEKATRVAQLAIDQLFLPTFKKLDEAFEGRKKTLVHCHGGASRSPTLLAAYIIWKFDVTVDQAIAYMRARRYCVNPKCMKDLRRYEADLKAFRNQNHQKSGEG